LLATVRGLCAQALAAGMAAVECGFIQGLLALDVRKGLAEALAFAAVKEATWALLQPRPAAEVLAEHEATVDRAAMVLGKEGELGLGELRRELLSRGGPGRQLAWAVDAQAKARRHAAHPRQDLARRVEACLRQPAAEEPEGGPEARLGARVLVRHASEPEKEPDKQYQERAVAQNPSGSEGEEREAIPASQAPPSAGQEEAAEKQGATEDQAQDMQDGAPKATLQEARRASKGVQAAPCRRRRAHFKLGAVGSGAYQETVQDEQKGERPRSGFEGLAGDQPPLGLWDPLGFAMDGDVGRFEMQREVDVQVSMTAAIGYVVPEYVMPPGCPSPSANLAFQGVQCGLRAFSAVPAAVWAQMSALAGFIEFVRNSSYGEPGNYGKGFLGLESVGVCASITDPAIRAKSLAAEQTGGRLAMVATIGMFLRDGLSGSAWGESTGNALRAPKDSAQQTPQHAREPCREGGEELKPAHKHGAQQHQGPHDAGGRCRGEGRRRQDGGRPGQAAHEGSEGAGSALRAPEDAVQQAHQPARGDCHEDGRQAGLSSSQLQAKLQSDLARLAEAESHLAKAQEVEQQARRKFIAAQVAEERLRRAGHGVAG